MAKMRVYELARDLNLTNKMLLSKLGDMDISVKSHMSSLDDEAVARIKAMIFGKKEETVEETRIKPTVIRRRRKKVKVAPEPSAVSDDVAEKSAEDAPDEKVAPKEAAEEQKAPETADGKPALEETPAEDIEAEETPAEQAEPVDQAAEPADLEDKKAKKAAKKAKKEEAAKIIHLPVKPVKKPSKKKAAPGDKGKVERLQWHGGENAFPLSRKGKALPMNKIDLLIESRHGDSFHLADTAERYLVDEKTENCSIFVGFSLPDRRR